MAQSDGKNDGGCAGCGGCLLVICLVIVAAGGWWFWMFTNRSGWSREFTPFLSEFGAWGVRNPDKLLLIGAGILALGAIFLWLGHCVDAGELKERQRKEAQEAEEARQRAAQAAEERRRREDAQSRQAYHTAIATIKHSHTELCQANNNTLAWIARAEMEFNAHAYAPFWDAVADALCWHKRAVESDAILTAAKDELQTRAARHPDLVASSPLSLIRYASPDLDAIGRSLQLIVRRAQTDLGFAQIYEMRKTNSLLSHGFADLVTALRILEQQLSRPRRR